MSTYAVHFLFYSGAYTEHASYTSLSDARWHARQHVLVGGGEPTTGYTRTMQGQDSTVYTSRDGKRAATVRQCM